MSILNDLQTKLLDYGCDGVILESDLINDLGMDSLDRAEFFLWCDEKYNIYINDYDAEGINTIFDLINVIDKKTKCECITEAQKKLCERFNNKFCGL